MGIFIAGIVLQLIVILELQASQHAQREQLKKQAVQFCMAEKEIRAKIVEIEVYLKKYVYVYFPPGCSTINLHVKKGGP